MKKLLSMLLFIFIICFSSPVDAAIHFYGFSTLTGGGTGALDKLTALADGDMAIGLVNGKAYTYKFNLASVDITNAVFTRIQPIDHIGCWEIASDNGEIDALLFDDSYTDSSLMAVCTAIAAMDNYIEENATILVKPGTWIQSANRDYTAVCPNATFKFAPGAVISHSTYTLSIPNVTGNPFFTGTGAVTLIGIDSVYPEMFGKNIIPGTTDMTAAINAAVVATTSGRVKFLPESYAVSATIKSATAQHPIYLEGTAEYYTGLGTRLKWIGGNNDSIIELNSYMHLSDMFIYNGNSATGLTCVDMAGDVSQAKTTLVLKNVHAKGCHVGFALNYSYYNSLYDCKATYNDIGYDVRTEANNINLYNCYAGSNGIGITNENGSAGGGQVLWSGGSLESNTTYGIKLIQANTYGWYFLNPHMEANQQHLLAGFVTIDTPYMNHEGAHAAVPPFDIAGSASVVIKNPVYGSVDTRLFTISGSAASYSLQGISIIDNFNKAKIANDLYATPEFLKNGYIKSDTFTVVETPWYTASGAIAENILTTGETWKLQGRYLVSAQLVVDTAIVTADGTFVISMGTSNPSTSHVNSTITSASIAAGVVNLPLVAGTPMIVYPGTYSYQVKGSAETSGKYKLVFIFI